MTSENAPITGITTIEEDPISGELYLIFPDDIAEAVGMDDWEWVEWDAQDDGTVIIRKSLRQDTDDEGEESDEGEEGDEGDHF